MSNDDWTKCDRHCAFCLKSLPSSTTKLCGSCKRRAYCSRECQISDWQPGKGGQGHKNWCKLQCGEEDLDWEIQPVLGKGLGVIAKRSIPAGYRIIVDALRRRDHPGINDLMPNDGRLDQKMAMNQLEFEDNQPAICLRIARVNHDCNPKAGHHDDSVHKVKLLISEREIRIGEEITISYTHVHAVYVSEMDPMQMVNPEMVLKLKWGITCPEDCFCKNQDAMEKVQECRKLLRDMEKQLKLKNASSAMDIVHQLLEKEPVKSCWHVEAGILLDGFRIGIMKKTTLKEANENVKRAYELLASSFHPNSNMVQQIKRYVDNPACHEEYLALDK